MTDSRITDQITAAPIAATLTESDGGGWTLVMQRRLRHAPVRVWPMLTRPDLLTRWSPVVPDRVLDSLGPATSRENPEDDPVDAEVLFVEPPHELVHRWREDTLRWTLEPLGDGTLLTLHHSFADRSTTPSYGAGWHVCLGTLSALDDFGPDRLDDPAAPSRVVGGVAVDYGWQRLYDAYAAELGITAQPLR